MEQGGSYVAAEDTAKETNSTKGDEEMAEVESVSSSRFSLLRPTADGKNQANILSAVVFLVRELREVLLTPPEKRDMAVPCRDGTFFRELATKLEIEVPILRGVTGPALWAMYDRTIKMYVGLRTVMAAETGEVFRSSRLVEFAEKLFNVNEQLLDYVSPNKSKARDRPEKGREAHVGPAESTSAPIVDRMAKRRRENFSPEPSRPQSDPTHLVDIVQELTILVKEQTHFIKEQTHSIKALQQSVSTITIAQNMLTADLRGIEVRMQQLLQQQQ
jgi:hypothetical protein